MTKITYSSDKKSFSYFDLLPWKIFIHLFKYRALIISTVTHDFRATYQASYFGIAWQVILPAIMIAIFYFVFGEIFGGRFLNDGKESPFEYALALYIGLGIFNFTSQVMNSSISLITSNSSFVKNLSYPLEVISIISVINNLINLIIGLILCFLFFIIYKSFIYPSIISIIFFLICLFLGGIGISWIISSTSVFIRDIGVVISPIALLLMFLCPIFYPMSMVPKNVKCVIEINPLANIIEGARAAFMYGVWPNLLGSIAIFTFSMSLFIFGYFVFMKTKSAFADVL